MNLVLSKVKEIITVWSLEEEGRVRVRPSFYSKSFPPVPEKKKFLFKF